MKQGLGCKIAPAAELARKERELERKEEDFNAGFSCYQEYTASCVQKNDELKKDKERERENHELKIRELKTDVYKRKRPLKEMGEVVKRESAILQRIFRTKELNIQQAIKELLLLRLREFESLNVRKLGLLEEREALILEKYAGDITTLHLQMLKLRETKEKAQNKWTEGREHLRRTEENVKLIDKQLDAINALLSSNDKGSATATATATATTSAADPGPVNTMAEPAPADTLLSNLVTDNPPTASAASPPSDSQKVLSPMDETMKKEEEQEEYDENAKREEKRAAFEEIVREKKADMKKKKDIIKNLEGKRDEQSQKLLDMGAYADLIGL